MTYYPNPMVMFFVHPQVALWAVLHYEGMGCLLNRGYI